MVLFCALPRMLKPFRYWIRACVVTVVLLCRYCVATEVCCAALPCDIVYTVLFWCCFVRLQGCSNASGTVVCCAVLCCVIVIISCVFPVVCCAVRSLLYVLYCPVVVLLCCFNSPHPHTLIPTPTPLRPYPLYPLPTPLRPFAQVPQRHTHRPAVQTTRDSN